MPTYLYCVLPHTEGLVPPPNGVGGAAVRVVAKGDLDLWVSDAPAELSATPEAMRAHDAVIHAALRAGRTPLPARFGCTFSSDEACAAELARRDDALRPLLHRVWGMVEMTVTTMIPVLPMPSITRDGVERAGAAMQMRTDSDRRTRSALEGIRSRLSRAVGPVARSEVATVRGSDPMALRVAYLIPRDGELDFRAAVAAVERDTAARLLVGGPTPPYDFGNVAPADE